ncbi:NAD(P)H-dependent FMN reductase [Streptococcus loxodontisalivarius]|uniref:NAD(P)H-dependent FMN reductase n=1 Tax=Streptococcus loxodontisalivarius TaxID=1349415 RepID=A0ABS2PT30_9STRE|nr:NAD(P)H-dependent FMN reductase [Streptococcus loxodontisalivarius]
MKIIGIVGSQAPFSHNRLLLQYIGYRFSHLFDLEILEIAGLPLFNQSDDQTDTPQIQNMVRKIEAADAVIIATPEHNHTISAVLKSCLEWLSFNVHPFDGKPVMIVGASYYQQGSSRAQLHLRQILDAPGVNAMVLPGNEFLLGNCKEAFDEKGFLKDEGTAKFLETCLTNFLKFLAVINGMKEIPVVQESAPVVGEADVDANSGASESWSATTNAVSTASAPATSPFEQALNDTFGPDLGIEPKEDIFDRIELV